PLQQFTLDVLAGLQPTAEVAPPPGERVDPRLHAVLPATQARQPEARLPAVVADRLHVHLGPLAGPGGPVAQHGGEHLVPVGGGVGGDGEVLADGPLDGEAPPYLRLDVLDDDARRGELRRLIHDGTPASPSSGYGRAVPRPCRP